MPKEGVDPSPSKEEGIFSPLRLPVPPLRLVSISKNDYSQEDSNPCHQDENLVS